MKWILLLATASLASCSKLVGEACMAPNELGTVTRMDKTPSCIGTCRRPGDFERVIFFDMGGGRQRICRGYNTLAYDQLVIGDRVNVTGLIRTTL